MGITTSSPASSVNSKLTSGCLALISSLRALESIANKCLSTNSLTVFFSLSPSTDVIIYFNLVDKFGELFLLIFLNPSNSLSILYSSCPSIILNVILALLWGKVKGNSLTPTFKISFLENGVLLISVKSTVCNSPNFKNSYLAPYPKILVAINNAFLSPKIRS